MRVLGTLDPPQKKLDEVTTAMGFERKLKGKANVLKAIPEDSRSQGGVRPADVEAAGCRAIC